MAMFGGARPGTDAWEAELVGIRSGGSGGPGQEASAKADTLRDWAKSSSAGGDQVDCRAAPDDRPHGRPKTQTIAVDENTSFKKEGESITLADSRPAITSSGPANQRRNVRRRQAHAGRYAPDAGRPPEGSHGPIRSKALQKAPTPRTPRFSTATDTTRMSEELPRPHSRWQSRWQSAWQPSRSGRVRASRLVTLLLMAQVAACPMRLGDKAASETGRGRLDSGRVQIGNMPIPGATVTASNTLSGQKVTNLDQRRRQYSLQGPASGRYVVSEMGGVCDDHRGNDQINATTPAQRVDLEIVLLSARKRLRRRNATQGGSERASAGAGAATRALGCSTARAPGLFGECWTDRPGSLDAPSQAFSPQYATSSVSVSGNATASDFQGGLGGG